MSKLHFLTPLIVVVLTACMEDRYSAYYDDASLTSIPISYDESESRTTDFPIHLHFRLAKDEGNTLEKLRPESFRPLIDPLQTFYHFLSEKRHTALGASGRREDYAVVLRGEIPLSDVGSYEFTPNENHYDPALMILVRDLKTKATSTLIAHTGTLSFTGHGPEGEYVDGSFKGRFIVGKGAFQVPTDVPLEQLEFVEIREGSFRLRHEDRIKSKRKRTYWEKWPRFTGTAQSSEQAS